MTIECSDFELSVKHMTNQITSLDHCTWQLIFHYTPASEASKELSNLTERKNMLTTFYGFEEIVCLSVTNFDLNYLRTG